MSEQPHNPRPPHHVSLRALVGGILLVAGIAVWIILIYAIFYFSAAVGEFLEIVMALAGSAK